MSLDTGELGDGQTTAS